MTPAKRKATSSSKKAASSSGESSAGAEASGGKQSKKRVKAAFALLEDAAPPAAHVSKLAKYAHPSSQLAKTAAASDEYVPHTAAAVAAAAPFSSADELEQDDDGLDLSQMAPRTRAPRAQQQHARSSQQHASHAAVSAASAPDSSQSASSGSIAECLICYRVLESHGLHVASTLSCGHLYGHSCVKRWVEQHHTCPVCKAKARVSHIRSVYAPSLTVADTGALIAAQEKNKLLHAEVVRLRGELADMKAQRNKVKHAHARMRAAEGSTVGR